MNTKVLVVDDEFLIRMSLESGLSDLGHQVKTAETFSEGLALAESWRPDVVLLDNKLGGELGLEHIEDFKKLDEDIQIIMITAYGSVSQAVEAMKRGACHYIQKPFDLEEVDLIIRRNLEQLKRRRSLELMRQRPRQIVGESEAIRRICRNVAILAENDNVDLLICGETGTGKGVVVNAIHDSSPRRDTPLVKINCGAIPESLLESELFGYEKGAFTGANKAKKGLMELANGGTVFLDEIGELPLAMQSKLLTFLEDRRFKRVGGLRDIEVNVRIIAATNRELKAMVAAKEFRDDLYYRLCVVPVSVPPLRERPLDIEALAGHFLKIFCRKHRIQRALPQEMAERLRRYPWPGNIRELRNTIENYVITGDEPFLPAAAPPAQEPAQRAHTAADLSLPLKAVLERAEEAQIRAALDACGGEVARAAELLGIHRSVLYKKIGKYGLGHGPSYR